MWPGASGANSTGVARRPGLNYPGVVDPEEMSIGNGDVSINLTRAILALVVAGTVLFAAGMVGSQYGSDGVAAVGFGLSFVAFATLIPLVIALVYQRVADGGDVD